ncbi:helix-turn-helix transcriptional regulator [Lactococcus cremoris]|uniref:helix-turn-helix transcriptional regulator n=1 Tax=Lactococcus lactis subsp. cremoris TaxID=1359 RepID=UPI0003ABC52C|nr:WYL domain-containing protein [Lactococcus cremoris]AGV72396.1 HTH domain-containing protein [Lactococcus cremoris subsp. cremoris KW2]
MKKAERLNQELIFLGNKEGFQLKDLMEEFQISKRTALRDVEELEGMGLPFYTENGRYGGYKLINQGLWTPVYFNNDEIEAIFFALDALKLLSSSPFEKSYRHIRQKLSATLPESQQEYISKMLTVVNFYGIAPVSKVTDLKLLMTAILSEKIVKMTYSQYEIKEIELQIYEIFYRNGLWICSAYDVNQEKWGTYRCDYMSEVEIIDDGRQTKKLSELKMIQETYERNYHDIPFRCRLTDFGKELYLKHHYPNMHLEEIAGIAYLVGAYHADELTYMTHYLCSYGNHLVIEEPQALIDSYLKQLSEMKAVYQE